MSDRMNPLSFAELMTRILKNYRKYGEILGVKPVKLLGRKMIPMFGEQMESPIGPAAGPNTQLAGNIVSAYAAGARFFELKTVQRMDGEELAQCVARPCISAAAEGYNVEWSTELTIIDAVAEYIRAWWALKLISKEFGFGDPNGFIFNMSVGYDLSGIKLPKVDGYINTMTNAAYSAAWQECKEWAIQHINDFRNIDFEYIENVSPQVSNSITISTLHGCPPDEIERIAVHLIRDKGVHTFVKCNPTLLGYQFARFTLDKLGYSNVEFGDLHYREDLQWEDAVPMFKRLMALAEERGVTFGLKLTNTKPVDITNGFLPGKEAYMSGSSLYPLSINLAAKISREFEGKLPISFAGGADAYNVNSIYDTGIYPITMATTILKPGGYQRMTQMVDQIGEKMPLEHIDVSKIATLAEDALVNPHYRTSIKPVKRKKISEKPPLFDCFAAPCSDTCPIHQDIPAYLKALARYDYTEAAKIIIERNPLPNITGTICPHTCMNNCNRKQYEGAVDIRGCKLEAAQKGLPEAIRDLKPVQLNGKTASVIGGGPGGLAAAYFLAKNGWKVDIYDKEAKFGGTVRNVIPEFRISEDAIEKDIDLIRAMGVEFHPNSDIQSLDVFDTDAVILAVGANRSSTLSLKNGSSLNAIDFLREAKAGKKLNLGKNVVVIGAGNSAMDAARAAKRIDGVRTVSIVYRRDIENMPADLEELELAIEDLVHFKPLMSPVSLENGKLECEVMELGERDASGRRKPVPTGKTAFIDCDTVIASLGEKIDAAFYEKLGIALDENGLPVSNDRIKVIGDGAYGPKTIVEAIASAAKAVQELCGADYGKYRVLNDDYAALSKRGLVNPKYRGPQSLRCLECSGYCGMCVESCPNRCNEVVSVYGKKQVIHIDALCNECGNCAVFCPYDGQPYRDKITVFANKEAMEDSTNRGFAPLGNGKYALRWDGEAEEALLDEIKDHDLRDLIRAYES